MDSRLIPPLHLSGNPPVAVLVPAHKFSNSHVFSRDYYGPITMCVILGTGVVSFTSITQRIWKYCYPFLAGSLANTMVITSS